MHQGDVVASTYQGPQLLSDGHWKDNVATGESQVTQGNVYGVDLFTG